MQGRRRQPGSGLSGRHVVPPAAWQQRPLRAGRPCSPRSCSTTSADNGTRSAWQLPASPPAGVTGFNGCPFPAEYWTFITLQPRPDGTLAGQYRAQSFAGVGCETERTVTFTRIGDVDLGSLPDPASQPVRAPTPAEAWHGRYHLTQTPKDTHYPSSVDGRVQTACLRTGERCLSEFHYVEGPDERTQYYNFTGGKWIFNTSENTKCNGGGSNPTTTYWEFPLPQPLQDPITLLTGVGHRDATGGGACAGSYDQDLKFERTGD